MASKKVTKEMRDHYWYSRMNEAVNLVYSAIGDAQLYKAIISMFKPSKHE